jgi:RNA polymerase sigma-70 factor (ECF subfamily)
VFVTDQVRTTITPGGEGAFDDERSLAEQARTDRQAFAALYRRHVAAVYGYAYRQCGSKDIAEEATSATFERALRAIDRFEWRGGGFRAWLFRIASNEVTEIHRRQARSTRPRGQLALRDLATPATGVDVSDEFDWGTESVALHRALAELHPRYRDAIALRYLGSMSADDAASALGCSKAVLAVTLYRGLGALRKALTTSLLSEAS